jgi:hypothetical protein
MLVHLKRGSSVELLLSGEKFNSKIFLVHVQTTDVADGHRKVSQKDKILLLVLCSGECLWKKNVTELYCVLNFKCLFPNIYIFGTKFRI